MRRGGGDEEHTEWHVRQEFNILVRYALLSGLVGFDDTGREAEKANRESRSV